MSTEPEVICVACRRPIHKSEVTRHGYFGVTHEKDRCISLLLAENDRAGAWQREAKVLLEKFEYAVSVLVENPPPVIRLGEPAVRFGDWINGGRKVCADTREFLRIGPVTAVEEGKSFDIKRLLMSDCKCVEIMQADETRHFKGCPLREKYPTLREFAEANPVSRLDMQRVLDMGPEMRRSFFEEQLEEHRKRIHSIMSSRPESADNWVSDALFFLLAVAHQPVPADYVSVDAVRERFEELEKRLEELEAVGALDVRVDAIERAVILHEKRIEKLEPIEQPKTIQDLVRKAIPFEHDRPRIVVLCGSTRFLEAFRQANLEETLKGNVVLTVGNMMHSDDGQEACVRCRATDRRQPCTKGYSQHQFEKLTSNWHTDTKKALDALHFKKIEMADEVFVLNVVVCKFCKKTPQEPKSTMGMCGWGPRSSMAVPCEFEPYIGESTKREILHALTLKKRIRFLNPQGPLAIVTVVEYVRPTYYYLESLGL